jgi:uncharacterized protein (DUF58 family)
MPRGRHVLGAATVSLSDPLGLETTCVTAPAAGTVLVRPRAVALDALFTEGRRDAGRRRPRLHRHAGLDLHSVRDYVEGEPLRLVHWPTTARRGTLTVRQLQDAPRDETAVLLDCDPDGAVGVAGSSSFDESVRIAASLLLAAASRSTATLVTTSSWTDVVRITDTGRSFDAALDRLAAVEPDAVTSLGAALSTTAGLGGARAAIVVTCRAEAARAALLDHGWLGGVVLVDAPTYAGRAPTPAIPALSSSGTPLVVVRRGDDLAQVLTGRWQDARSA